MSQEKFVNYYIELLTGTITESIQKNLVLQTEKRVSEQIIKEMSESFKKKETELENSLKEKRNEADSLRHQLGEMRKQKDVVVSQSDEMKRNINHLETFKNELLKERKENERLNAELIKVREELAHTVESYQKLLPTRVVNPAFDLKKKKKENNAETIEDAGSF